MKKIILALFLAAAFVFSGCTINIGPTSPSPSESAASPTVTETQPPSPSVSSTEAAAADYFPFKENVHMVYKGTGNEYAAYESSVDYLTDNAIQIRANNGGTVTVSVYTAENGAVTKVFAQGETYYRHDYTSTRTMSDILIKEPIAAGTTWTLADGAQRTITAVGTDVTVPYGSFKALEITTKNGYSTIKDYYALGTGLIKSEFVSNEDTSSAITSELERLEEDVPMAESVRFFYPDFNKDRVSFVDKSLEFYTGETVAAKFEAEFKQIPSGSSLSPVMKAGAKINSIAFDPATGVVTVDFSKEFITLMNAGTTLEGMILSSVADTLGSYFQTDKVQITIDGGPYESGHFLFGPDDYLPVDFDRTAPYEAP